MTTTRIFKSTDPGAPQLTGQNGALLGILTACLVGISGIAYGTGADQKTAAGWSMPFTNGATKGVFRNALAAGGTGCYVRILDDGSLTAGAEEATLAAYSAMSDLDTGSGATPNSTGFFVRKSETTDNVQRPWILIADECTFYLWIDSGDTSPVLNSSSQKLYGAGDYISFAIGDGTRFFCSGRDSAGYCGFIHGTATTTDSSNWHSNVVASDHTLSLAPVVCGISIPNNYFNINSIVSRSALADPTPGFGGRIYMPAIIICSSSTGVPRGRYRGLFFSLNNSADKFISGTAFSASEGSFNAGLVGLQGFSNPVGALGAIFIDIANTWEQ